MDCLVLPVTVLKKRYMGCSRLGYRPLREEHEDEDAGLFEEVENQVTVVVGKEKREFLVDPFVLEENPFRILIQAMNKDKKKKKKKKKKKEMVKCDGKKRVVFVDVDAILFEHMLWLMHNDCSSLFQLNLMEIIDFYAQDN